MTSVFLVLMVRPKFTQALEKQSISCCIFCSLLVLSAQLSANKKSLMTSLVYLRHRLKSPGVDQPAINPISDRYTILAVAEDMAEKTILKSIGAITQPCFTAFVTGKASDSSLSSSTFTIVPQWNCRTIVMNLLV